MTELERRALLGDKQAQKECTRQGIVLPCPFCGSEKSKVRHACGDYFVECLKCHCTSSLTSTKETVIKDWNTRPSPPIGSCSECARRYKGHCVFGPCAAEETDADFYCGNFKEKGRSDEE